MSEPVHTDKMGVQTHAEGEGGIPTEKNNKTSSKPHVPDAKEPYLNHYNGLMYDLRSFIYDCIIALYYILFTTFFREIKVRGGRNVPEVGTPTLLVCAPHANQFIDPAIVMLKTRLLTHRSGRQTCFIIAEKSYREKIMGFFGRCVGGIPVARIQDNLKPFDSDVEIYAPDLDNNPKLIKGRCKQIGKSPNFKNRLQAKSLVGLPNFLGNARIAEVVDDETLLLAQPFPLKRSSKIPTLLKKGCNFMYAPKIDNSQTFQSVFDHLHTKGCVGIFPEGGSHDRPSLLPIKAGVVIMALGAVAADPSMKVHVVPCGLHYFHREKFRSRAVIEYGEPIIVDAEMGAQYKSDPRATVSKLLDRVTDALFSVTENAPDYDTLMTIQATRRLYQPRNYRLSLPLVVEINRRLLVGYDKYKEDPRIIHLKQMVNEYNDRLYKLGLKDHQVESLNTSTFGLVRSLVTLLQRLVRLVIFFALSLPGSILFSPIFIAAHKYSQKVAKAGLKKSVVKIKGTDLIATWKIVVALIGAPILYTTYSIVLIILYNRGNKYARMLWIPFPNSNFLKFIHFYSLLVFTTYSSLKTGEIGMDLFKSLPPLFVLLFAPQTQIEQLKQTRRKLSREISDVCDELGPTVFPDYDKFLLSNLSKRGSDGKLDETKVKEINTRINVYPNRSRSSSISSRISNALSTVNSRGSLADISIFGDAGYSLSATTSRRSSVVVSEDEDKIEMVDETARLVVENGNNDDYQGTTRGESGSMHRRKVAALKISSLVRERWQSELQKEE